MIANNNSRFVRKRKVIILLAVNTLASGNETIQQSSYGRPFEAERLISVYPDFR